MKWLLLVFILFAQSVYAREAVNCEKVKNDDLLCLACNIYHESGNQTLDGKIAVGAVTINRVKSLYYPDSICRVVWQKRQFSWTIDDKSDIAANPLWWTQALDIAQGFMVTTGRPHGAFVDPTNCALFYHADYVDPYWRKDKAMRKTTRIENHIFYRNLALGCPNEETLAASL